MQRRIDPLGLVLKAGAWYLVARAGRDIRTYKIAKMLALEALDEPFAYPARFNLASHWRRELKRFEAGLRKAEATLRVSPVVSSRLDHLGADIADAVRQARPDAQGWREATVPIESIGHAAGLLLGFADAIEVLAPPALRRRLADLAGRVTALYREVDKAQP